MDYGWEKYLKIFYWLKYILCNCVILLVGFFFIIFFEFNEISSLLIYSWIEMDRKIDEIKLMSYIYSLFLFILYI